MYTNNKSDNSKEKQRTKLTEMGVVVIDEEHSSNGTNSSNGTKEKNESAQESKQKETKQSLLNEGDAPVDMTLVDAKEKRSRFKRVLIGGGVILCLLCLLFGAAYFWLSSNSRESEEHKVKTNSSSTNRADEQPQGITAEEISQELNKHKAEKGNQTAQTESSTSNDSPVTDRLPNEDLSATVNSNDDTNSQSDVGSNSSARNVGVTSNASTANSSSVPNVTTDSKSLFTEARSIRVSASQPYKPEEIKTEENKSLPTNDNVTSSSENRTTRKTNAAFALPPFGTMLPVRTVGTVFTLRTDSYIRLQLTRDVSGQGWALQRGTEIFGTVRGAELETGRAFISLVGFIDPNTNRFVRLQCSVMGSDGADGVRGKKHKLNSGWVNALKKVGAEVLDTAKSAATGIGRRPVVITESSPRIVDPIAVEISGLVVNKNGFVEVPAGTICYLLVTTLPNEIQSTDAEVNSLNPNQLSAQNQLSEDELAYLLTNGNKEEIRLALPRMSPQMRRVAEAFLANK